MIWRWVWRTIGLFLARKLWDAWQRRRHPERSAAVTADRPRAARR